METIRYQPDGKYLNLPVFEKAACLLEAGAKYLGGQQDLPKDLSELTPGHSLVVVVYNPLFDAALVVDAFELPRMHQEREFGDTRSWDIFEIESSKLVRV